MIKIPPLQQTESYHMSSKEDNTGCLNDPESVKEESGVYPTICQSDPDSRSGDGKKCICSTCSYMEFIHSILKSTFSLLQPMSGIILHNAEMVSIDLWHLNQGQRNSERSKILEKSEISAYLEFMPLSVDLLEMFQFNIYPVTQITTYLLNRLVFFLYPNA